MKMRALILTAVLLTTASCHLGNGPSPSPTPARRARPAKTVTVKLHISGAASVVADMDPPAIIFPNFRDAGHEVLLAAAPAYAAGGLPLSATQIGEDDKIEGEFKYAVLPPAGMTTGVEIDLKASGVTFAEGSRVTMDRGDESTATCPDPFEGTRPESLHWVPRLTKVSKASQRLRLKESFSGKDPALKDVVSRLELHGGTLETELTSQERTFRFVVGEPAPDDVVQTVAMSLLYTFQVELPEGAPFVLMGRKFGTAGGRNDLVELGRFLPDSSGNIQLDLMNVPPDDFFNVRRTATIPHFHLHYRIVDGSFREALPVLKGQCTSGTRPQFECGPSQP